MKTQEQAARGRADRKQYSGVSKDSIRNKEIKKSYGKTPSEMNAEERRVFVAEWGVIAAHEEHCKAVAVYKEHCKAVAVSRKELAAAYKAAKKAKCSRRFWSWPF